MDISLTPFQLRRPEHVVWRFPENNADILEAVQSKGLRQFLRGVDEVLQNAGIRVEFLTLSLEAFEQWLPYYQQKMEENEFRVLASPEWYAKKMEQGVTVEGLMVYRGDELIGSAVMTQKAQEKMTMAFKASDRIDLTNKSNSSLGAAIDFLFLREAKKRGIQIISAGKSRNAFGVLNTFGYLDYKMKFGYLPQADEQSELLEAVPVSETGTVIFFGQKENTWALYGLKPVGDPTVFEFARFATPEMPFVVIEY